MDLKERIGLLTDLLAELEEKQEAVKKEIIDTVLFVDREEITQEVIDWYYWESGLSTVPLVKAIGCGNSQQIVKLVTSPMEVKFSCLICKENNISIKASSRSAITEHKRDHSRLLRHYKYYPNSINVSTTKFICPACLDKHFQKEARRINNKYNTAAKIRVTKTGEGQDLENMPYAEYLETNYWKKFAHNARKRAGYECQQCGEKNTLLDVHHLTYERRGKEWPTDVKVLCRSCHAAIHGMAVK